MILAVTSALVVGCIGQQVTDVYSVDVGVPLYAEGVTYDRTTQRVTLSSIPLTMFSQLDATDNMSLIDNYYYDVNTSFVWCLGLKHDPDHSNIIWTVQNVDTSGQHGSRVAAYQLHDATSTNDAYAELRVGHELVVANQSLYLNDLTLDPSGNVYVTDSFKSSVEMISGPDAFAGVSGTFSTLTSEDELGNTDGSSFNSNGIVYVEHTDGDFLLVVVGGALQKLVKVSVASGAQTEVFVSGGLGGGDGLVLLPDGRLVVVQSDAVLLVKPTTSEWKNATVQYTVPLSYGANYATTAALADTDLSVFITFARFLDIMVDIGGATTEASTLVRVEFPADEEEDSTDESETTTSESDTVDSNNESDTTTELVSSLSLRDSVSLTFALATLKLLAT
mmetsp:Transcript_37868/g.100841  ORF Transcript_37868/g.100841 Transcript_37868/m.100841 type:complete len:392 (-) Transcript_37868:106-1281(-)|eukprot:CAMPEP_0194501938 /NCGR_PEP_ID=MMETSP0253-20130528/23699_1 /TAXON_ID=2966 /ORGANISM="Noctiluca scintillans" /LENGTH=391 /DNA_ID=CAMNT_0039343999 /DNA_START=66 /DNA_END=1241 /DNA_ORIENTATION=+